MTQRANYNSERPLTEQEREFAARPENHDLIYVFCAKEGYSAEEYYDILAVAYLQSVKKYHEVTRLQEFSFCAILFNDLRRTMGNYFRALNTKKRMPEGGFCSLNATIEGDRSYSEYNNHEAWFEDKTIDILQDLIDDENEKLWPQKFDEMIQYLTDRCTRKEWGAKEFKTIVEMLIEGYTRKQALRDVNRGKERRKGIGYKDGKRYTFTYIFDGYEEKDLDYDLKEFREVFREIFGC